MHLIEYNSYSDIKIQFDDNWAAIVHTTYGHFKNGTVKNPYHPNKYGGIVGDKRNSSSNGAMCKEYIAWYNILIRCYDVKHKIKSPRYIGCKVCDEWKYYWNFYDWICAQENYDAWRKEDNWAIDKDIKFKHNKIYSPNNCLLVSKRINNLFLKANSIRGKYPLGVCLKTLRNGRQVFEAQCNNPFLHKQVTIGIYDTPLMAFLAYKKYKEEIVKMTAKEEFQKGNISTECYKYMMNYEVEIDD